MSRNDEYDSASMENPREKMADLEKVIAREDEEKENERKYAPHDAPESLSRDEDVEEKTTASAEESSESPQSSSEPEKKGGDEIEEETGEEVEEIVEEDEEKPHSSSFFWNIVIVLVILMLGGMGFMYWKQMQTMPKTPLENAMEEYRMLKDIYTKEKIAFFDVQKQQISNELYLQKLEQIAALEETVLLKQKKIDDLKREIMGVRGEIRSYFSRYKANTRKKARNLHFDSIMTVKTGQTYLDATIQRVADDFVSVVHAGGAVRIAPDDLPEAIQTRLAYGDPLGIAMMDEEIRQQQEESKRRKPSAVSVAEEMNATEQKIYNAPSVSAPAPAPAPLPPVPVSSADLEPPSKLPDVKTRHDEAPVSGQPSLPSVPSDQNWKPAPVPAPFIEES